MLKADGASAVPSTFTALAEQTHNFTTAESGQNGEDLALGVFTLDDEKVYFGYQVTIQNKQPAHTAIYVAIIAPALGVKNAAGVEYVTLVTASSSVKIGEDPQTETSGAYEVAYGETLVVTYVFQIDPTLAPHGLTGANLKIGSNFGLGTTPGNAVEALGLD